MTWIEIFAGALPGLASLFGLMYAYGRLSQKVDVLWLAVFNHLGLDERQLLSEHRLRLRRFRP